MPRLIYAEIIVHGIAIGRTPAWLEELDDEQEDSDPVELLASEPAPRVQA